MNKWYKQSQAFIFFLMKLVTQKEICEIIFNGILTVMINNLSSLTVITNLLIKNAWNSTDLWKYIAIYVV